MYITEIGCHGYIIKVLARAQRKEGVNVKHMTASKA